MNSTIKGVLIFLAGLATGVGFSYIFTHKFEVVEVEEEKEPPEKVDEENVRKVEEFLDDADKNVLVNYSGFGARTNCSGNPNVIPELPVYQPKNDEPAMESGEIIGMKVLYYDPDMDELTDEFLDPVDLEPGAEDYIRERVMEAGNIWLHTTDADESKDVSYNGVDYKVIFSAGSTWESDDEEDH